VVLTLYQASDWKWDADEQAKREWKSLQISNDGCSAAITYAGSTQGYKDAGCRNISRDYQANSGSISTTAKCVDGEKADEQPEKCFTKVMSRPKVLANASALDAKCKNGFYGKNCQDFALEENDICELAGSHSALPDYNKLPSDNCENGTVFTVFQKKNNTVEFAQLQLCGGASPVNCYIADVCKGPTTTITSTTITSTTTTTTTLDYECHCKVFVDGQGPHCEGKCCTSKGNEGGVGFDSDCKTETSEEGCNERINGVGQQYCLYKTTTYWKNLTR